MLEYHEKYGDSFQFWFGRYLAVMLSDVEDLEVRTILTNFKAELLCLFIELDCNFQIVFMNSKMLGKPKIFKPFNVYFGDGLFVTESSMYHQTYTMSVKSKNNVPRCSFCNPCNEFVDIF